LQKFIDCFLPVAGAKKKNFFRKKDKEKEFNKKTNARIIDFLEIGIKLFMNNKKMNF
jgi:hypothetical protein